MADSGTGGLVFQRRNASRGRFLGPASASIGPRAQVVRFFGPKGAIMKRCAVRMTPTLVLAQRVLPLSVLLVAAISVPVMAFSPEGLSRLEHLQQEKKRADAEVTRLSQQIQELRAEVQRIKEDPTLVERAARDELGLVRKTEVVFQFKD